MTEIPTTEPQTITAGDTVQWKKQIDDYPASDDWVLSYAMVSGSKKYSLTASASGDDHLVSIAATTSAAYEAGEYYWQAYVTKDSERRLVGSGRLKINPNFADLSNFDARSHVKKTLDAIEAVVEGRATKDQEEYTIGTRSLKRTPIQDLLVLRDKYKGEYLREVNAENISKGLGSKNRILVRI